jgi:SAM-dependent methyltransferase
MSSWASGYVTDLGYTHGFYRELTPSLLAFAALTRGIRAPLTDTGFSVCELGCGQGVSANVLAASNPSVEMHGVDFNPAQIAGARVLSSAADLSNVTFHEVSFSELSATAGLSGPFDMITLHGVYSWVSQENRQHILSFIRTRLKPGGLVYVSYNTLPGWAPVMPLRQLLVDHAASSAGPRLVRIERAIAFASRLSETNPAYLRVTPNLVERIEKVRGQDRHYLAHEYFNRDWKPFYHHELVAELAEAKLSHVGSAHLLDHVDTVNLTSEQQAFLASIEDPTQRETVRDYIVNQQFRRDVFVKGAVPLSPLESRERWLNTLFALSTLRADVPLTINGVLGEANLQPDVYSPLLDAFAAGPRTVRQLLTERDIAGLGWARLTQALMILVAVGHLQPSLGQKGEGERTRRARAFNSVVMERAKDSADIQFLASPVTGGGVAVDRVQQLFLLARHTKHPDPIAFAWETLGAFGHRLINDGKTLETAEENLAELRDRFAAFTEKRQPVLQQLGIA